MMVLYESQGYYMNHRGIISHHDHKVITTYLILEIAM